MDCRDGLMGLVGNTPLVRLRRASEETGCEILGKAEFLNPGGSVKDRTALGIIRDAERRGHLQPGGRIVEGTAGNTGIGLCMLGNALGYRTTIVIPDRPGNNRLDTMANITANPNVGLLFFVPGFEDTLRLNGRARITDDPALLSACTVNGKQPVVGIVVTVEEVFLHCAKALKRSKLWEPDYRQDRAQLPSIARMILEQTSTQVAEPEAAKIDDEVEEDYRTALY